MPNPRDWDRIGDEADASILDAENVMLGKLILVFILVPLADLILLMYLSDYTGLRFSVALVIVSGVLGAFLAKQSSVAVGKKIRQQMTQGEMSPALLGDGAMILFAAGLLLTPGFITDAIGLSLLIPACRRWYQRRLVAWMKRNFKVHAVQTTFVDEFGTAADNLDTVDGEVVSTRSGNPIHDSLPNLIQDSERDE